MKNSSKNNYSGNNSKQHKKNSGSNFYPKNTYSSNKKNKFSINSSRNKIDNFLNENDKNKVNFSTLNRRKPVNKSNI